VDNGSRRRAISVTKLDEIEAKHTDGYGYDGDRESVMPLAGALIDMHLLIRAVRQLGAVLDAAEKQDTWSDELAEAFNVLQPDVRELLEQGDD